MAVTSTARPALAPGALSFSFADYNVSETTDSDEPSSSSDRKASVAASLPTELIQQILYLVDAETFASLILLNRAWRKAADDPQIYAYHLSRCPSFATAHTVLRSPFEPDDLLKFKRSLVQEAKRNLFAAFLRPQQTIINLISTTTSSSAAFPYGEGFDFLFSHRGHYCLALSSSRIIILDTASRNVTVKRELKVVRRPLSACILADGSLLAVLAANHRVHIYEMTEEKALLKRSIELDQTAHTITMTVHGEILAAGCEGGVEVVSLAETGPQTAKRVIKCDRVDHLAFSEDGTMLLGTTQQSRIPSTVILTAPYFTDFSEHEMDHTELLSHLWTSQIIFPNGSRDCSHAALLPRKQDQDANWTLTYDRVFESFRAVRSDDLRNGTTYFTGPEPRQPSQQRARQLSKSSLTPKTLPAITPQGALVAAAFLSSEIWLYGVPEDLERSGARNSQTRTGSMTSSPAPSTASSPRSSRREMERLPRWQVLVDKYRNAFAKGRKVANVNGASNMCWFVPDTDARGTQDVKERLVIAAPGGVSDNSELEQEELAVFDGGRLVVLDFAWSPRGGKKQELTIEVGNVEPQLLEEESMDMDAEIAVVRRRTQARREGATRSTVSSVAGVLRPTGMNEAPPVPPAPVGYGLDRIGTDETASSEEPVTSADDANAVTLEEAIEGLDVPYSQTNPRSRGTVYRSAAAVEASRARQPSHPASGQPVQYRRTDGTELPHESDADNWVPPPPAYGMHTDDNTLSEEMRRLMMPLDYQTSSDNATSSTTARPSNSLVGSRRPVSSIEARRSAENRRRSSADVEGSRWFSRHEDNRAASPALNDGAANRSLNSHVPLTEWRPLSGYEARSSIYRAALQPAASMAPILEPGTMRVASPLVSPVSFPPRPDSLTLSGGNQQQRLEFALPPTPESEHPAREHTPQPVIRERLHQPTRERSLPTTIAAAEQPYAPPPRASTHPRFDSQTDPIQQIRRNRTTPASATNPSVQAPATRRPSQSIVEPSAYQLNQMALASMPRPSTTVGVTEEAPSASRPPSSRRRMPRIASLTRLSGLTSSAKDSGTTQLRSPSSATNTTSPSAAPEYSSSRRHRGGGGGDPSDSAPTLSPPLEQSLLQAPLDLGSLDAPSASGPPPPTRPSSRLSARFFRRPKPQPEPTAAPFTHPTSTADAVNRASFANAVPFALDATVPRPRAQARTHAQTQSVVDTAESRVAPGRESARRRGWERAPFAPIGEEEPVVDRRASTGDALRSGRARRAGPDGLPDGMLDGAVLRSVRSETGGGGGGGGGGDGGRGGFDGGGIETGPAQDNAEGRKARRARRAVAPDAGGAEKKKGARCVAM